jgi:hypothetical protein
LTKKITVHMNVFGLDMSIPVRFEVYLSQLPALMFLVSMEGVDGDKKLYAHWIERLQELIQLKKSLDPATVNDELLEELIQRSLALSLLGNFWMSSPDHIEADWDVMAQIDLLKKSRGIEMHIARIKKQFLEGDLNETRS